MKSPARELRTRSTPRIVGLLFYFAGEIESAGIVDVRDAERAEVGALGFAAGGGEDFSASVFGELDSGETHAAGSGVNEDFFAALELGNFVEAVVGGEEGVGHAGGDVRGDTSGDATRSAGRW